MIKIEDLENRIRHYFDMGFKIWQIETGTLYDNAVNVLPCKYTYEETNELISEEPLEANEVVNILLGKNE